MNEIPPPADDGTISLQTEDCERLILKPRDDLGVEGLYEWRSGEPGDPSFRIRWWKLYPEGRASKPILQDVTADILKRLLTGLGDSKARSAARKKKEPPEIPRMREGQEPDVIADPDIPRAGVVRVVRRISTVERLVRAKTLNRRHQSAADRLYFAYMVGVEGAREIDGELPPGVRLPGWAKGEVSTWRLMALREYHEATAMLGGPLTRALTHLVIEDMSISGLAEKMRWNKRKVLGYVQAGLECLAGHWNIS